MNDGFIIRIIKSFLSYFFAAPQKDSTHLSLGEDGLNIIPELFSV